MKAPKTKSKPDSYERLIEPEIAAVRAVIAPLASGGRPILVGPFTSEVGFELLYWIPFLRWAVHEFPELRGRLVVISRGGTEHWLSGLDARYVDLLSFLTPEEFVSGRSEQKQRQVTDFELDVYERVRSRLGLGRADVLHPSVFFNLYYRATKIERHAFVRPLRNVEGGVEGLMARFERLPMPELGELDGVLPDDYVAARFYFRPSFPDSPENRRFAESILDGLASRTTVVLLNNRLELDEHRDFVGLSHPNVVTLDHLMTPETNLAVQTAALSRARAFVGTYGGLAYLGPFLGVPSIGFTTSYEGTRSWHFDLADRVFEGEDWGSIVLVRPQHLPLLDLVSRNFRQPDRDAR